jgi:hypothetical protein
MVDASVGGDGPLDLGDVQDAFTSMWVPLSEMETQTDFDNFIPVYTPGPLGLGISGYLPPAALGTVDPSTGIEYGTDVYYTEEGDVGLEGRVLDGSRGRGLVAPPIASAGDAVGRHLAAAIPPGVSEATRNLLLAKHNESRAKQSKNLRQIDDVTTFTAEEVASFAGISDAVVSALISARADGSRAMEFALASLARELTDEEKAVVRGVVVVGVTRPLHVVDGCLVLV